MNEPDISLDQEGLARMIADSFADLHKRFDATDARLDKIESRLDVLEAQYKDLRLNISQIPDQIDRTYAGMLNDHEERLRVLETA